MNKQLVKGLVVIATGYTMVFTSANANAFSFQSVLMWIKNMQSEMSAWAVTTKQTAVAANQSAASRNAADQQLATAMGAISMSDRVGEALISVDGTKAAASNCSDAVRIEYNDVNEDDDGTASINVTTTRTCPGRATCEISYTGTAARSGGSSPTPVPGATVTPGGPSSPPGRRRGHGSPRLRGGPGCGCR